LPVATARTKNNTLETKKKNRKPNSKKKMREPSVKHTQLIARDQNKYFLPPPHEQKTAKGQQEAPAAEPQQKAA
jgi:hypothetical protein